MKKDRQTIRVRMQMDLNLVPQLMPLLSFSVELILFQICHEN